MGEKGSPVDEKSIESTGESTLLRYGYQTWYACLKSLELLNPKFDVKNIYHEYHEDILIEKNDGKFLGYQIKTRNTDRTQFKFSEDVIINTLSHFTKLDLLFNDFFDNFFIVTNFDYWKGNNTNNIFYCIESCINDGDILENTTFLKNIDKIKVKSKCDNIDDVLNTIKKVELIKSYSLESIKLEVINRLYKLTNNLVGWDIFEKAANNLYHELFDRGTENIEDVFKSYELLSEKYKTQKLDDYVKHKKFGNDELSLILDKWVNDDYVRLRKSTPVNIELKPRNWRMMHKKMSYGGVPIMHIDNMEDLSFSTDFLFKQWINKWGADKANELHEDIRIKVRTKSLEAYDETHTTTEPFGHLMYENITNKMNNMYDDEYTHNKFSISEYKLLGTVGLLTDDCELYWTDPPEIPEGDV